MGMAIRPLPIDISLELISSRGYSAGVMGMRKMRAMLGIKSGALCHSVSQWIHTVHSKDHAR